MPFRCLHCEYIQIIFFCFAFNAELNYLVARDMQILGVCSFMYTFFGKVNICTPTLKLQTFPIF